MTQRVLKSSVVFGVILSMASAGSSFANVSLRNLNGFVAFNDFVLPGGLEAKIGHVYNSLSYTRTGDLGGWGDELSTYLVPSGDGSAVIHEYGTGAENRFRAASFNAQNLDKSVDEIANVARAMGVAGSAATFADYRNKLKNNVNFRESEEAKFRRQGKLTAKVVPVGTQLQSNQFSSQTLFRIANGWERRYDTGKVDRFDDRGRLVRVTDKNGNFADLAYGKDGHLATYKDNLHRKLFFTYNERGQREGIDGGNNKKVTYKYNSLGEMVSSRDMDGNVFTYEYETQGRRLLSKIKHSDGTSIDYAYYSGAGQDAKVKRVKERDGSVMEYILNSDSADKGHTAVGLIAKGSDGKVLSNAKYEYYMKRKPDGEEWTYRMVSTIDSQKTTTTYNECCGLPLSIVNGNSETTFTYDTKGRVTRKETPLEVTQLTYNPSVGKVARVSKFPKANKKAVTWSAFEYDQNGNLKFAKNSRGQGERIFYDKQGRILVLMDNKNNQVSFKYNDDSRPIEITDSKVGSIRVSYTNNGEINKVESSAGRKIASQVSATFQNLMQIIEPAGVTLTSH